MGVSGSREQRLPRLLLTGASGFLGRNCLEALQDGVWEIHAVDRRPVDAGPNLRWHRTDLLDAHQVGELMAAVEPTHLLHLAWTGGDLVYHSLENFQWVGASLDLFQQFAAFGGQRVVALGSSAEYQWGSDDCSEDRTPLAGDTPYGVCKSSLYRLFESWRRQSGVSGAWARPFFLFGPHESPSRLVASVIIALLRDQPARCTHGRQQRDYLYSRDAADALVHLLTDDFDGAVNIGTGQAISVASLVGLIARQLGRENLLELGALPSREGEAPRVVADVRRLREEVGWRPRLDLEPALTETIDWWRQRLGGDSDDSEE